MKNLFYNSYLILIGLLVFSCKTESPKSSIKSISDLSEIEISKTELLNKIKGGWAGQVIGCTYGGPTEFKWNGTDQYGQKLANGVYLYRVVTNLNGKSLDKYTSEKDDTDKYFNKGYGKMYLMR